MARAPRSGEPGASRIPEATGSVSCGNGGIPISQPSRSPTRMRASPGPCWQTTKPTIPAWRLDRPEDAGTSRQRSQGGPTKPLQRSAEMVKAVTPSLPEPGVWTGMASANVLEPLRWKRAKTHRGSRHRHMPHQEAGYTSAAVALDPQHAEHRCNRVGSIYVHTWHNSDLAGGSRYVCLQALRRHARHRTRQPRLTQSGSRAR